MSHDNSWISESGRVMRSNSGSARSFLRVTRGCGLFVVTLAVCTLAGWGHRLLPGYVGMAADAAACFILVGSVLLLLSQKDYSSTPGKRNFIRCLLGLTGLVAILSLLNIFVGLESGSGFFLHMSISTSVTLIVVALSLDRLDWEPKAGHRPSQYLAMFAVMFPLQALLGHINHAIYRSSSLAQIPQMSIPSSMACLALTVGILSARPDHGFMRIVASDSLAGQIIRRLFFPLIVCIPVLSLLIGSGVEIMFSPAVASSAFVIIFILLLTLVAWVTAETVHGAERKLLANEDRLRKIFEKAPIGMTEVDPVTHRFREVNAAFCNMIGYSENELSRMTMEQVGLSLAAMKTVTRSEHELARKDGTSLWASIGVATLRNPQDEPSAHIIIAQDISDRVAMENANQQSNERLKLALAASQIGFYDWDIQQNAILLDPQMSQDWGLAHPLNTLEAALDLIHPDDRPHVQQAIDSSIATGQPYMVEYRVLRPMDGLWVWVEVRGEVQKDRDGNPTRFLGTCLNISVRKQAEQRLQESEARFRQFADAMPQMAFVANAQGDILYFNRRHYDYFGIDPVDSEGSRWEKQNLHHPDDIQRTLKQWAASISSEKPYQIEYRLRRSDGEYCWHLGRANPLRNSQGEVIQWLGTNTDIHEHKLASQQLQENEAKFRTITDAMPQMVWSTLADGYHDYYNKRWYEFTGVPEGSTDGAEWNGMFHPDDQDRAWTSWKHSLATGEPYEIEYRLRHRSGHYRWTLGRALPVRNERGDIIRWMGTCTDIHDQKMASDVLAASEARTQAILSQLPVGVVIADGNGQITTTNEAFRMIWGGVKHVGMDRYKEYEGYWFDSGQRLEAQDWALARALSQSKIILNEVVRLKTFDGQEKIILSSACPVHTETGELTGAIAVVQDISEQKRFEAELGLAKDEAERANRAKSDFLANMSHEIRSPMNSVIGYADLLAEPDLDEEERLVYALRIKASGSHLLHIIDDILDLSKVESGQFQVECRRFPVTDLIYECIQSMSVLAEKKKIELMVVCDTPVPQFIESDSIRFRQILMNVVGNAIKFTEHGRVRVGLRFQETSKRGPASFCVDVEDSGIGIDSARQSELFRPFTQTDASITRKFGGTGLGLHLSRRLAEALGGSLKLTWSVAGHGSCFTFTVLVGDAVDSDCVTSFDRIPTIPMRMDRVEPSLGGQFKVLIVDDNPDNQALLKAYLRKVGVQMEMANDGQKALDLALQNNYDIILMDVMMPVMDGLEATRQLRARGYCKPVIALTAHAMKEEVEKSFAAGCDGHISKPVDIKELLATIRRFVDFSQKSEQQMLH
ncbi:MAG TPA: PAS domain S-box protein [Oligoflexus sp.]|uniref:PAS domain S-box protein n=1 Tax=Oligoflexus sp. TaxID=1971216 RepID=UPI002D44B1BB|nr:PAS domain S-box protein [Oligoflexus sp.]HYX39576.1 PAS domain S-box protein [Oligoflexus sp.]